MHMSEKKMSPSRPRTYSAPPGSKRARELDATTADLESGDPERIERAYRRREKMEKRARKKPGWKNVPRRDTRGATAEGLELLRALIREALMC
jgi:hypothetical protein